MTTKYNRVPEDIRGVFMSKIGLILEGGAMRSVFSAGILDFYLDKGIDIENVLAVSAGAYAGMNYVSGQRGRVMSAIIEPMAEQKIFGLKHFLKTGDFFNMDLIFDEIPKKRSPFDFEAFKNSGKRFITSTINCDTGEEKYYDSFESLDEFLSILRVGNSLPFLAKVGELNGERFMDGGMANAIPIDKAIEEGWDKIIVVLTREATYRKDGSDIYNSWIVKVLYRKYKGLMDAINVRPEKYNASLDLIEKLSQEGKVMVYRPEGIKLSNNEGNPDVLKHYYDVGYKTAESRYDELLSFLNS